MSRTALTNVVVIDMTGAEPYRATVVVDDGQIAEVRRGADASAPVDATAIDCHGGHLVPGLIDAHVHIGAIDIDFEAQHRVYPTTLLALLMAERLERMLMMGFTSVRDAGGADWGMKTGVERGIVPGPRLQFCGRPLSQTGGHGDIRGPSEPGDYHFDGSVGMTHAIADGVDAVRHAAREELRRGADAVKLYCSGGPASPPSAPASRSDRAQYSPEEVRVAVEEAERAGTYVLAHAIALESIQLCVDAGVRSIEHGNGLDAPTAAKMAQAGAYLVPTLAWYDTLADGERFGLPARLQSRGAGAADATRAAIRHALDAGVPVGFGTDLCGPTLDRMPEALSLQAAVMGGHEALVAATRTNAELMNIDDVCGTVEVGKHADLLVVDGDPASEPERLADLSNLRLIMKGGVLHKNLLDVR